MAKITATKRERWVLFQLINPMPHQTRADRRAWDRIYDALGLEEINDVLAAFAPGAAISPAIFDAEEEHDFELTSDQRDKVIELLERPGLTTQGGRMIARFEREILKSRDGEQAAAS